MFFRVVFTLINDNCSRIQQRGAREAARKRALNKDNNIYIKPVTYHAAAKSWQQGRVVNLQDDRVDRRDLHASSKN